MKRNRLYRFGAAITAALLCAVLSAQAAIPAVINYQSRLRTAGGVAIKTATNVSFSLYSAAMGGSKLWTESYSQSSGACTKVMPDANGYFSVQMGSCEAFPSTITFTTPLFLGVTIENDAEATPRVAFAPAPYAMNAVRVGNFVSDISAGTLTGEPLGTATLDTQGFHSAGLLLQGSGWDGSVAANTGFKVRTTATDASNYRLSFLNTTDGSESVSILNNGRVGIGIANPQSELEVAGIIYADDFRTRGGTISTTGDGTNDLIRFTRPKLFIGHTASVTTVSPVTNLIELKEDAVTFLQDTYFGKLVSIPSRQIKLGDNIFTFPIAAPGANDLVLTTDTEGELSWTPKSSGGGSGSVTSVELSAPSTEFLVAGSPVTDSGTLSLAWKAQQPNDILAGPASGAAADVPTFRKLDPLDIPDLTAAKITSGTFGIDLIPNLSADKITSGTLGIDRIPDIPSAKVTGVLDDTNIPVLDIAIKTSGTLAVTRGGTGLATTAQGDLIFSDAINSLARLTIGTTGKVLTVSSVGLPIWSDPTTSGTVTSVGLTAPSSILTVSGSPVTGSGDLALDLAPQSARKVFIGPLTGTEKPTFRDLTSDDIPDLSAAKITSGTLGIDRIPDIPSARVTGTLGVAQIPDLSADKITTGTLSADRIPVLDIATKTSGTLAVTRGGTGLATTAQGDILFSDAINSLATLRIGADGQILTVNSAGLPVWQAATAAGVTSVGLKLPSSLFAVTGSPVTSSGTISTSLADQDANMVFAGPVLNGILPKAPTFRKLDPIDIPALDAGKITSGVFAAARIPAVSSSSIPDLDADKITSGVFNIARIPNIPAANITGVLATSSIPSLDASKITSGTFGVAQGGTGLSTVGAAGTVLTSVGGTPQWSPVPAGLSGSGAFGQLAFWNASSTLAGNSKIIIDNTNSRLAIGTTASPATTLVVAGDTTVGGDVVPSTASAYDFGSTTKPVRSVYSDNLGSATQRIKAAYIDELYIYGGAGGSGTSTISATQTVFNGIAYNWPSGGLGNNFVLTTDTNGNLGWQNPTNLVPESGWRSLSGNVRLGVITDKVGIGTATPATKLDVVGDIQASGFLSSGTGQIKFGGAMYNFPTTLGSAGQVLTASSSGALAWQTPTSGIGGTGTVDTLPILTGASTIGNSLVTQAGNEVRIMSGDFRVMATSSLNYLNVGNTARLQGNVYLGGGIPSGTTVMVDAGLLTLTGGMSLNGPSSFVRGDFNIGMLGGPQAGFGVLKINNGSLVIPFGAGAGKILTSDNAGNASWQAAAAGGVSGSGAVNAIPLFSTSSTVSNSVLSQVPGTTPYVVPGTFSVLTGAATTVNATSNIAIAGNLYVGAVGGINDIVGLTRFGRDISTTSGNITATNGQVVGNNGVTVGVSINALTPSVSIGNAGMPFASLFTKALSLSTGAGAGKVLTSDATGNATWQTAAAAGSVLSGTVGKVPYFNTSSTLASSFITTTATTTVIGSGIMPQADNAYDLGSLTARWRDIYVGPAAIKVVNNSGQIIESIGEGSGANVGKLVVKGSTGERLIGSSAFGSGTAGALPVFNASGTLSNSLVSQVGGKIAFGVQAQMNGGMTVRNPSTGTDVVTLGYATSSFVNAIEAQNGIRISGGAFEADNITPKSTAVISDGVYVSSGSSNLGRSDKPFSSVWARDLDVNNMLTVRRMFNAPSLLATQGFVTVNGLLNISSGGSLLVSNGGFRVAGGIPTDLDGITTARGPVTLSGGLKITGSGMGVGKVLTSDSAGNATWQAVATGGGGGVSGSGTAGRIPLFSSSGVIGDSSISQLSSVNGVSGGISVSTSGFYPSGNADNPNSYSTILGTPTHRWSQLYLSDSLFITGGAGAGKVLTSDANGRGTWQDLPASSGTTGNFVAISASGTITGNGALKFTNGAGAGKVLTSDASGNATWQAPASGGGAETGTYSGGVKTISAGKLSVNGNVEILNGPGKSFGFYSSGGTFMNVLGLSTSGNSVSLNQPLSDGGSLNIRNLNSSGKISFQIGGTEKYLINSSGASSVSDRRMKDSITNLSGVLDKLDAVQGVNFTWKDEKIKKKQLGVIAQDVEKSFPELVDTDSQTGMKSVNYGGLAAVALQGVKELDAKVDAAVPTTGEGMIRAGESEVSIFTLQSASVAKIFITPVGSTGGQVLYVGEIKAGEYFTVKTDKAVRSPARFNWMIIK